MRYTLVFLALLVFSAAGEAARIYVSPGGSDLASGDSWQAATSLHRALRSAGPGDVIWAQVGTYLTSPDAERQRSFVIPAGVRLLGGFGGRERHSDQRIPGRRSVLSGELGAPHDHTDNAYTVVTMRGGGPSGSVLDGFTIVGGHGRGYTDKITPQNVGGGLYIEASPEGGARHSILNCSFEDNFAHNGGGVYLAGGQTLFQDCLFISNDADLNGGAVYVRSRAVPAEPTFVRCTFLDNAGNSGAGLANDGTGGQVNASVIDCRFVDNVALVTGAAVLNISDEAGISEATLEGCVFRGNESILGDDVAYQTPHVILPPPVNREPTGGTFKPAPPGARGGSLRPAGQ